MTTKQAAEFLNVSVGTLERWRKENRSPPYIKTGRYIRYGENELQDWLRQHRQL